MSYQRNWIAVGNLVKIYIPAQKRFHEMYITDIEDGRVIFHNGPPSGTPMRGGWWLPIDFVRQHSSLLKRAQPSIPDAGPHAKPLQDGEELCP